jgi:hypothetical protein
MPLGFQQSLHVLTSFLKIIQKQELVIIKKRDALVYASRL